MLYTLHTTMAATVLQVASEGDASINIAYKGIDYKPRSQKEVLTQVKQLMDGIPKDTIDVSAEIIISMSKASTAQNNLWSMRLLAIIFTGLLSTVQVDVPTFEFVDLPGLVAYPPAAKEKSENTLRRYLESPNTM